MTTKTTRMMVILKMRNQRIILGAAKNKRRKRITAEAVLDQTMVIQTTNIPEAAAMITKKTKRTKRTAAEAVLDLTIVIQTMIIPEAATKKTKKTKRMKTTKRRRGEDEG
jgi:hypothetical protein